VKIKFTQNVTTVSWFSRICFFLVVFCLLLITPFSALSAFDFSIRPHGYVFFPSGEGNIARDTDNNITGDARYNTGGGGGLGLDIDLSTIFPNPLGLGYTIGLEGGLSFNPLTNSINVTFLYGGGGLGLYFFPLSRIFMRVDGAMGVYQSSFTDIHGNDFSGSSIYWRTGGEVGFRFTPSFLISANVGWRQLEGRELIQTIVDGEIVIEEGAMTFDKDRRTNSGLYAGITAQITFQTGRGSNEGVRTALNQQEPMYPAFMQGYQRNSIGNVVLRNQENAEIRDVRLYFRAPGFTSSEYLCGTLPVIPRGRSANLPLLADFSSAVLRFTDSGRILGELVIRYRFLGQEREVVRAVTVATHNRNMVTTDDLSALASFISPTSPDTLSFARFVAGLERVNRRTGHNTNLNYAIWLLEAMRASGIRIGETYSSEGEVQFPAETLSFRTGNSRDLALLFAACLEGVGIPSALIQTESEFLVAVGLGVNTSGAETLFNGTDRIVIVNDFAWLPISISNMSTGFFTSWNRGAAHLRESFNEGKHVDFVVVEDAWAYYPPALMPELGVEAIRTDNAALTREATRGLQQYIDQEIIPLIAIIQRQGATAALNNRLGIVLVRAGRTSEGKAAYERAIAQGSVPAMTNRGNLALTERDFAGAERWFNQALARDPENRAALRGLERVAASR